MILFWNDFQQSLASQRKGTEEAEYWTILKMGSWQLGKNKQTKKDD